MSTATDVDVDSIDLNDLDLFSEGPPYEVWAAMRAQAPVHRNNSSPGDVPFWSITRYDMMESLFKDSERLSNARDGIQIDRGTFVPAEFENQLFLFMDPPEHRRHRGIVQSVFSPGAIAAREPDIRRVVVGLIDSVIERGECDLVDDLASRLPLIVMCDLLGVPEADREDIFHWTNAMAAPQEPELRGTESPEEIIGKFAMYLVGLVNARKAALGDDLLSRIITAEIDGESLNDLEVVATFALLVGAGIDTTRNTCGGGALLLNEQRDVRAQLIENPSRMADATEEIIRRVSPFLYMSRTATCDTEIMGTPIAENDKVVLWIGSANHDQSEFPDPLLIDLDRNHTRHIAFGGGGRHHCLGNRLARLEVRLFFEELLARMPNYELAGPPRRIRSNMANGLLHLPISYTPAARTR